MRQDMMNKHKQRSIWLVSSFLRNELLRQSTFESTNIVEVRQKMRQLLFHQRSIRWSFCCFLSFASTAKWMISHPFDTCIWCHSRWRSQGFPHPSDGEYYPDFTLGSPTDNRQKWLSTLRASLATLIDFVNIFVRPSNQALWIKFGCKDTI